MAIKKVKLKNMSGDQLIPDVGIPSQTGNNGKVLGTNGSSLQFVDMPTVTSTYTATGTDAVNGVAVSNAIATKQDNLVSGTNIKTINGTSILGSGNITIETSSTPNVDGTTVSYNSNDALQTIAVKNVRDNSVLPIWHGTEQQWNQGGSSAWYYWQTSTTALWTSGGALPSSVNWQSPAYGNGNFVTVGYNSSSAAYSTDGGITWQSASLPSSAAWFSPIYGDGSFVTNINNSRVSSVAYSTDSGVTWQSASLPTTGSWNICFGDERFIAIKRKSTDTAYSTNGGKNWISGGALPISSTWTSPAYGDGNFVTVGYNSSSAAYSTDGGITWQSASLPSSRTWSNPIYGDGSFVVIGLYDSSSAAYSTDGGATWHSTSLPIYSSSWTSPAYGDGSFVIASYNNDKVAYSTNGGVTWQSASLPSSGTWLSLVYGDGKFIMVDDTTGKVVYSTDGGETWSQTSLPASTGSWKIPAYGNKNFINTSAGSTDSAIFTIQYDKCYTDTATPTTSSIVYSEPETVSSYTISSVTSGAITLSNNNTYYYNQSGNQFTYDTIGNTHPEYLCFIDGVGVKMGNTLIAGNTPITTSITSTSTDAEVPSAKAVYDEVGEVESALNTINSGS